MYWLIILLWLNSFNEVACIIINYPGDSIDCQLELSLQYLYSGRNYTCLLKQKQQQKKNINQNFGSKRSRYETIRRFFLQQGDPILLLSTAWCLLLLVYCDWWPQVILSHKMWMMCELTPLQEMDRQGSSWRDKRTDHPRRMNTYMNAL